MAELTVDAVARRLGKRRRCRTRDFPLPGTPAEPWREFAAAATSRLQDRFQLSEESAWHLVCRYGRRVGEVAGYLESSPELVCPVVDGEPDLHVEWPYQRDHEMAMTPADHLLRRTRLGLFHPELLTSAIADGGAEMRMSPGR
jgi:glycerol-3-phosphate dehydrogenase